MLQRTIRAAGIAVMCLAGAAVTEGAAAAAASAAQVPCRVGGPHGLIAAVKAANRAGRGTLNLAGRCTYILRAPDNEIDGGNGLPVLTGRITINGRAGTTIARSRASSTPDFRILEVARGATVSLTNLTLTRGRLSVDFQGGAIDNEGTVANLSHDSIRGNSAGFGGGVYNKGRIINLTNDGITGNSAGNGGGVANIRLINTFADDTVSGNRAGIGGGITNTGSIVSLRDTTVASNRLTGNGAGGGIANTFGRVNMSRDRVVDNTATAGAQASGGGIDNSGRLTVAGSVVSGNVARGVGGGIRNEEQVAPEAVLAVTRTKVIQNTVTSLRGPATGGGVYNAGVMSLANSTVRRNRATTRTGRAVGAGIYNIGSLTVSGTAASANVVSDPGGVAEGGGLYVDEGSKKTALLSSTITGNRVTGAHPRGGGIFFAGGARVRLIKTVVAGNAPQNCLPAGSVIGCRNSRRGAADIG